MAEKRITDVDYLDSLNSNESFFVNHNNAIKQISKNNVVFDIVNGGTGANNVVDARTNLGAAAVEHNHDASDITSGTIAKERLPVLSANDVGALPTAGGEMTGAFVMNGGDIVLKEGVNYGTEEQMPTAGIVGRIFLKKVETSS